MALTFENNLDWLNGRTDEELVEFSYENEVAVTILIERYVKLIWVKANKMADSIVDAEDLAQEGLLGFLNAVSNFDKSRNVKFSTFAEVCINNKIMTALLKNNRNEFPIEETIVSEDETAVDNPESILLQKERLKELYINIISLLTERELEIFKLYLKDSSYEQIAQKLAVSPKSVDNAMQRVRRKLKKMWRADHLIN